MIGQFQPEGAHPVEKLWREIGLPEYFLGNGGTNTKLYELYDRIRGEAVAVPDPEAREAVARAICGKFTPYNLQGKNREAWVEIEWRGYLSIADAALAALPSEAIGCKDYECENCIGMIEHGCYCQAMGAVAPGGPSEAIGREGYVLVPREPTREMWAAMADAVVGKTAVHHDVVVEAVYRAMIASLVTRPNRGGADV